MMLCDSKRSSFITDFFELQFDTATFIIPSFGMIKAIEVATEVQNLIYYVVTWYQVRIYMQYVRYSSSITRPTAAVLMI